MSRVDQYDIRVKLAGNRIPEPWDKMTGGRITADTVKYRPGNMAPQISLGGHKSIEDVTVQRLFKQGRDNALLQQWVNYTGRATMEVHKQPLNIDGHPVGPALVYVGKLMDVKPPDVDSESTSAALIELVMSVDGDPIAS